MKSFNKENKSLYVFYEGKCSLCNKEMNYYKKKDKENKIQFIDISSSHFHSSFYGLDEKEVFKILHIQKKDGSVVLGVDAFLALWEELNIFPFFQFLCKNYVFKSFLKVGYFIFSRYVRPRISSHSVSS